MNSKHQRTLQAIQGKPVSPNIRWQDIEALFVALGSEISEGNGSRVRIKLNGISMVFHRPHPAPQTDKGALVSVGKFLKMAGIL